MYNRLLGIAGISGFLAVALGAFGAHGLSGSLLPNELATYETANQYHFYHTLVLVFIAILYARDESRMLRLAAYAYIDGIVLFSGSLYLLACRNILDIATWSFLGPITPVGGVFLLIGWFILAWYGFKYATVQRFRKKLNNTNNDRLLDEP